MLALSALLLGPLHVAAVAVVVAVAVVSASTVKCDV